MFTFKQEHLGRLSSGGRADRLASQAPPSSVKVSQGKHLTLSTPDEVVTNILRLLEADGSLI